MAFLATSLSARFRKILTEISKAPPRAVALASYLGEGYSQSLNRTPAKDLMAFGSVLQHTQHNIGMYYTLPSDKRISSFSLSSSWSSSFFFLIVAPLFSNKNSFSNVICKPENVTPNRLMVMIQSESNLLCSCMFNAQKITLSVSEILIMENDHYFN